jgi:hypothetical protein
MIMSVDPQSSQLKKRERERADRREDKRRLKGSKPILKQGLTLERFLMVVFRVLSFKNKIKIK